VTVDNATESDSERFRGGLSMNLDRIMRELDRLISIRAIIVGALVLFVVIIIGGYYGF
jgi:hypothetical protein